MSKVVLLEAALEIPRLSLRSRHSEPSRADLLFGQAPWADGLLRSSLQLQAAPASLGMPLGALAAHPVP